MAVPEARGEWPRAAWGAAGGWGRKAPSASGDARASSGRSSAACGGGAGARAQSQCTTGCLLPSYLRFSSTQFRACTIHLFSRTSVFIFFWPHVSSPARGRTTCVLDDEPSSPSVPVPGPVLPCFPQRGRPGASLSPAPSCPASRGEGVWGPPCPLPRPALLPAARASGAPLWVLPTQRVASVSV